MSIEEYCRRRIEKQYDEAKDIVLGYYRKYKKIPDKEVLRAYFWIFEERDKELPDFFQKINNRSEKSNDLFKSTKPLFNGYDEFIKSINLK